MYRAFTCYVTAALRVHVLVMKITLMVHLSLAPYNVRFKYRCNAELEVVWTLSDLSYFSYVILCTSLHSVYVMVSHPLGLTFVHIELYLCSVWGPGAPSIYAWN